MVFPLSVRKKIQHVAQAAADAASDDFIRHLATD